MTIKKQLQQIANTLIVYSYHIPNMGLINGKMGIAFYLYHYARYADDPIYSDFADDLIDEILAAMIRLPVDFENGVIGIAWGVNFLMKNKFVDGDPNDIFSNIDTKLFVNVKNNPQCSLFGYGLYYLLRRDNVDLSNQAELLLEYFLRQLSGYKGVLSLYYLNSIFYFLMKVEERKQYGQTVQLKKMLPDILEKTVKYGNYDNVDVLVFNDILQSVDVERRKTWNRISYLKNDKIVHSTQDPVCFFIKKTLLYMLYLDDKKIIIPESNQIDRFISQKMNSLQIPDFLYLQGLVGLGTGLLRCL